MIKIDITKKIRTYEGANQLRIKTSVVIDSVTQVLGLSGAGKTTFLKILAGLIRPEQGSIVVNDEVWLDTKKNFSLEPQKRNLGFVFQDYALFPNMTVEKHLLFGTQDTAYIKSLLQIGRLEAFIDHKPGQLSGGQQQRLAILRALSTRPKILLMDEPFSALDNSLKSNLITDLKKMFKEQKITCLVVTHQPFIIGKFADFTFEVE